MLPSKIRLKSGAIFWIDPLPAVGKQAVLANFLWGNLLETQF
jgi:hypothetical protein